MTAWEWTTLDLNIPFVFELLQTEKPAYVERNIQAACTNFFFLRLQLKPSFPYNTTGIGFLLCQLFVIFPLCKEKD